MATETRLVTAEELFRMSDREGRVELVDGEVRRMTPAGAKHGGIANEIAVSLTNFVKAHGLGKVLAAETGFIIRRNPDSVRAPDVAFVQKARWNEPEGFFDGPPDLAVEVVSPNDNFTEVDEKVKAWLRAGTRLVIVVIPRTRSANIHRSLNDASSIDITGSLDGGDVVPGWTLSLRDLFVS